MTETKTVDPAVVAGRLELIVQDAPCDSCNATWAACDEEFQRDPSAPFGCCSACRHVADPGAHSALVQEIESGTARTADEIRAERQAEKDERAALRAAHTTPDGKVLTLRAKLEQGTWWRTKQGEWLRVAEMRERHRRNTAAMLLRGAAAYAELVAWSELGLLAGPFGDAPKDVVDMMFREQEIRDQDPEAWMRGTVLYRALLDGIHE